MNIKAIALFAAPVLTAGATAFVDYLANAASPFDRATLQHAALASVLVDLAILKQMLLPPPPAAKDPK